jgi:hypothetical protein
VSDLAFKVAKRRVEPITFTIEGEDHEYAFTPPKRAALMMPVMENAENALVASKEAFAWLDKGLSKEDADRIAARLRDPEDDFDIDGLEAIMVGLVEAISARPTT